jgi:hypothetical protein
MSGAVDDGILQDNPGHRELMATILISVCGLVTAHHKAKQAAIIVLPFFFGSLSTNPEYQLRQMDRA